MRKYIRANIPNTVYDVQLNKYEDFLTKFERIIFWFSIIDIFFLPYFPLVSVSFSVPFVAFWMLFHAQQMLKNEDGVTFFIIALFMLFGTLISGFYPGVFRWETTFGTTIKRTFQFIICFGYYFFYKYVFLKKRILINRILMFFSIYVTLLALFFLVAPRTYADIKMIINPVDNHTARYLAGTHLYRFNFLWTDPNNIAYLMDAIVMWFLLDKDEQFKNKLIIIVLAAVVVLATSSNGGIILLVVALAYILLVKVFASSLQIKVSTIVIIIIIPIIVYFVIRYTPLYQVIKINLVDKLRARMMFYTSSQNYSGGRFDDIRLAVNFLSPLMLFVGVGKEGISTENGHLYWIGMYGFPSYLCFMYFVFAKFKSVPFKRYVWVLPVFVAFTLNIAIGEFKWLAIFFLMLACSRYEYKNKMK